MLFFLVSLVVLSFCLSFAFSFCLPAHLHKVSGSYVHFCPRPCLSTCRWARLATHRHWGPLCVYPVPLCPLWPCNHSMCVIAKETGQSPWARTCSKTWTFISKAPPHLGVPLFACRSAQKTTIPKIGGRFSVIHGCRSLLLQLVFSAAPCASCTVVLRKKVTKVFSCNRCATKK